MSEYSIEVDFAPIYECVTSLTAFFSKQNHGALEAGKTWVQKVQDQFAPITLQQMQEKVKVLGDFSLAPFIWKCPGSRSVSGFMDWFEALSTGELYEISASCGQSVPSNLPKLRDLASELLREWDRNYFSHIDPVIIEALQREAESLEPQLKKLSSIELYEKATGGMRLYPSESLKQVVLIPQYHSRPLVTSSIHETVIFTYYSCDIFPPPQGYPAPSLLRLTRALSDETRLRILHLLARKQMTFSEIVREINLSKSTIHYHLITLRAAGLVIVHYSAKSVEYKSVEYSLRHEALNHLPLQIESYLGEPKILGGDDNAIS